MTGWLRRALSLKPGETGSEWGAAVCLSLAALVLALRPWWTPEVPGGLAVEVVGDVPAPGVYLLKPATAAMAVAAAGGEPGHAPARMLVDGDTVWVSDVGVQVVDPSHPLASGLRVDVNRASEEVLATVPGLGAGTARALVQARSHEVFYTLEDLARVPGLSGYRLAEIQPFLTVGQVGPAPQPLPPDLNTDGEDRLVELPGIGPALAARIVAYREAHGPFETLQDLTRVRGIGASTVAGLQGVVRLDGTVQGTLPLGEEAS